MKKLNTIFMGNPEFCLSALKTLEHNKHINLVLICGGLDKKIGRGQKVSSPPTIKFAKENETPYIQSENINKSDEFFEKVKDQKIDLIVVFAFSHFLSSKILEIPQLGSFNVHTSLLPKYRGSSPIHYSLLNGDKETGVTIQKMVKKMDAGDIFISKKIDIFEDDDYISLCKKFEFELPALINDFSHKVSADQIYLTPQDENHATFAPLIRKEQGQINPCSDDFITLKNKLRAFSFWPGVFCFLNHQRFKIHAIELSPKNIPQNDVEISHHGLLIGLKEQTIRLKKIQPPGKKPMSDHDFINGQAKNIELKMTQAETC